MPVAMRVPSAMIPSSITTAVLPAIQRFLMLPRYVSERSRNLGRLHCIPMEVSSRSAADGRILCDEACNGKGWLICDLCQGQKTNVKANNNRIYRRCPSCKAMGYILCQKCKVFKCVTFPNDDDDGDGGSSL